MGTTFGGDDRLPLVAPVDVVTVAAEGLTRSTGSRVRYVASDEQTPTEVARVQWVTLTEEQATRAWSSSTCPRPSLRNYWRIHNRSMWQGYAQQRPATSALPIAQRKT
jgi:hypothetical protein